MNMREWSRLELVIVNGIANLKEYTVKAALGNPKIVKAAKAINAAGLELGGEVDCINLYDDEYCDPEEYWAIIRALSKL